MKRPDFDTFREIFLSCLAGAAGQEAAAAGAEWSGIGDGEVRRKVLEAVKEKIREEYGLEFEVNHRLLSVPGPVESAVIQTFHELNTIYLMERINAKIRAKMN
ncbi:MAG: hypothetical protein K6T29_01430 [Peptococcaceae bacterium]|nr:hypothetical protein [Peptococcaceae bacterium]